MSISVSTDFSDFCSRLKMPDADVSNIIYRYHAITRRINKDFRDLDSDVSYSFYVGSYGRGTEIYTSDIDIVVFLPYEVYVQYNNYAYNGQSQLLQAVKNSLKKTYSSSTLNGDGQVVDINFSDGIKFEIVSAFINKDGSYTYPDSNEGGRWRVMNPKAEINEFNTMNKNCNSNLTNLCKMVREWNRKNGVCMPGILIDTIAYRFLSNYQYKDETNLFLVSSRYYSPELCRWISPDDIEYLDPESVNGLNLYCYCLNNPIMYVDPDGHMALWVLALIGVSACGLINGIVNTMTKMPEESVWGAFAGGFFEGAVSAAALAAGFAIGTFTGGAGWVLLGGTVAVTGGFIGGKYGNAISQQISYGNVDWGVANLNGGFAALTNLVSYAGLYMNKDILSTSGKLGIRFLENVGPSAVGLGITAYLASLPKPNLNEFRDEERIKSQRGRFIWDYWF